MYLNFNLNKYLIIKLNKNFLNKTSHSDTYNLYYGLRQNRYIVNIVFFLFHLKRTFFFLETLVFNHGLIYFYNPLYLFNKYYFKYLYIFNNYIYGTLTNYKQIILTTKLNLKPARSFILYDLKKNKYLINEINKNKIPLIGLINSSDKISNMNINYIIPYGVFNKISIQFFYDLIIRVIFLGYKKRLIQLFKKVLNYNNNNISLKSKKKNKYYSRFLSNKNFLKNSKIEVNKSHQYNFNLNNIYLKKKLRNIYDYNSIKFLKNKNFYKKHNLNIYNINSINYLSQNFGRIKRLFRKKFLRKRNLFTKKPRFPHKFVYLLKIRYNRKSRIFERVRVKLKYLRRKKRRNKYLRSFLHKYTFSKYEYLNNQIKPIFYEQNLTNNFDRFNHNQYVIAAKQKNRKKNRRKTKFKKKK